MTYKLLLTLLFVFPMVFVCQAQDPEENYAILDASEKWKTTLHYSGLIGTPCEEDQNAWLSKNQHTMWGLSLMNSQTVDIEKDGKIDLALFFITPEKCVQGTPWETGSDHGLLVFKDPRGGGELIEIGNLTNIIDDKIKFKMLDLMTDPILKTKIHYQKIEGPYIHGSYDAWLPTDAGCCPSYSGTFSYDFNFIKMELKNRKNQ